MDRGRKRNERNVDTGLLLPTGKGATGTVTFSLIPHKPRSPVASLQSPWIPLDRAVQLESQCSVRGKVADKSKSPSWDMDISIWTCRTGQPLYIGGNGIQYQNPVHVGRQPVTGQKKGMHLGAVRATLWSPPTAVAQLRLLRLSSRRDVCRASLRYPHRCVPGAGRCSYPGCEICAPMHGMSSRCMRSQIFRTTLACPGLVEHYL